MENNFENIKNNITKVIFENIVTGKKDKSFKTFINEVKKSKILKKQLDVYYIIENETFDDKEDAKFFLDKTLQEFKNYSQQEIEQDNKNLVESYGDTFNGGDNVYKTIVGLYTKDGKINSEATKSFRKLYESMIKKKEEIIEDKNIPTASKKEIKRATYLVNEKYSFLTENERKIFKSFINKDEAQKEELYNELISENLKLVKRKQFENSDDELNGKLSEIENKLKEDKYLEGKTIGDFSKMIDLSRNLL